MLWGAHKYGRMRWQYRTVYREYADNGIGNTACNGCETDGERNCPDRERGSGNQANCDCHRAYNNRKAKGRIKAYGNNKTDRTIGGGKKLKPKKKHSRTLKTYRKNYMWVLNDRRRVISKAIAVKPSVWEIGSAQW